MQRTLLAHAGRLAVIGWLMLAAAVLFQAADTRVPWVATYMVVTVLGILSALLTTAALVAVISPFGVGRYTRIAIGALCALSIVALALVNWVTVFWSILLTIAALIAAQAIARSGAGTRTSTWVLGASWPLGFAVFASLDRIGFGRMDDYGEYPWAGGLGIAVWAVLYAAGLGKLGSDANTTDVPPTQPAAVLA